MTYAGPNRNSRPTLPIGPRTATFICKARSFQLFTMAYALYSRQQSGREALFLWLIVDTVILTGSFSLSGSLTDVFRSGRQAWGLGHPIAQTRMAPLVNGPLKTPLGSTSRRNFCNLS